MASGSTAEAEQEQPAPSAEPEKQPETSTWADDSGSSGSALDVTSRLVIDGGKEYVEAGEKFQLVISYNVPELGADQGNAYSGGVIQFTLPQYLHVARTEDGDYQIVGAEVTSTSYDDLANTYFVNLNDGGALASNQTNNGNRSPGDRQPDHTGWDNSAAERFSVSGVLYSQRVPMTKILRRFRSVCFYNSTGKGGLAGSEGDHQRGCRCSLCARW